MMATEMGDRHREQDRINLLTYSPALRREDSGFKQKLQAETRLMFSSPMDNALPTNANYIREKAVPEGQGFRPTFSVILNISFFTAQQLTKHARSVAAHG